MLDYNHELKAYFQFCQQYFPNSYNYKNLTQKNTISKLIKTLSIYNILFDYDVSLAENIHIEAYKCIQSTIKLLYSIPVGDDLYSSTCLRQLAESLLHIVYIQYVDNSIETSELDSKGYRFLWKDGIKSSSSYKNSNLTGFHNSISDVNNIYQKRSDIIHYENPQLKNPTDYIKQILLFGTESNLQQLYHEIKIIFKFVIDYLPLICNFDVDLMTMSQRAEYLNLINNL